MSSGFYKFDEKRLPTPEESIGIMLGDAWRLRQQAKAEPSPTRMVELFRVAEEIEKHVEAFIDFHLTKRRG